MRLTEKPKTVKAKRPDDRLLGFRFDGYAVMRLTVMRLSEKPQTVKAERPDDRLLIIGFDGYAVMRLGEIAGILELYGG